MKRKNALSIMGTATVILLTTSVLAFSWEPQQASIQKIESINEVEVGSYSHIHDNSIARVSLLLSQATLDEADNDSNLIDVTEDEELYMFTNTTVNIREDKNIKSKKIDTLAPNTNVRVIENSHKWSYVVVDEVLHGFIKNEFLSEEETPISKLNRWSIDLDQSEIELLANIVWLEARGESQKGKECVVEVVLNRMVSDYFGGSLYDVLSAKRQFSTWKSRNTANPGSDEFAAIYNALNGNTDHLSIDYVYFSTKKVNGSDFIKIGSHWFSK